MTLQVYRISLFSIYACPETHQFHICHGSEGSNFGRGWVRIDTHGMLVHSDSPRNSADLRVEFHPKLFGPTVLIIKIMARLFRLSRRENRFILNGWRFTFVLVIIMLAQGFILLGPRGTSFHKKELAGTPTVNVTPDPLDLTELAGHFAGSQFSKQVQAKHHKLVNEPLRNPAASKAYWYLPIAYDHEAARPRWFLLMAPFAEGRFVDTAGSVNIAVPSTHCNGRGVFVIPGNTTLFVFANAALTESTSYPLVHLYPLQTDEELEALRGDFCHE